MRFFYKSNLITLLLLLSASSYAVKQSSLDQWIHLEQKAIDRTVNPQLVYPPDIQNQKVEFRPEEGKWFKLRTLWIPEEELNVAEIESLVPNDLKSEFSRTVNGKKEYRLFIHPESENFYKSFIDKYPSELSHEATSTASSRSLLVKSIKEPNKTYFVKLSLDVNLGGVVRTIPSGEVARSVGTTSYLTQNTNLSKGFEIMPESIGISPKGWKRGGQIIRIIPDKVSQGKTTLVPMFSLYAKREGQETLLVELAKKNKMEPIDFVRNKILEPFFQNWADWAVKGSVVMEAHAQNFLMEIDMQGVPTGKFIHRDMGGFNIDGDSKLFDKKFLNDMPVFTTFSEDYHQPFIKNAKRQSIGTYFEGGFIYNIDKELERINPQYKPKSIFNDMNAIKLKAISEVSGVPFLELVQASSRQAQEFPIEYAITHFKKSTDIEKKSCSIKSIISYFFVGSKK